MDNSPPVGSPPATLPCGPCAGPPTNCLADVQTLHQQYCDLKTNYQAVLQKLAMLRSSLASQQLMFNDILGDIAGLQAQIDAFNGTDCSRLGAATEAGALLVCDAGVQKNLAAPTTDGSFLAAVGGKWKSLNGWLMFKPELAVLHNAAGNGSFPIAFPNFPAVGPVYALVQTDVSLGLGSVTGHADAIMGGRTIGHFNAYGSPGEDYDFMLVNVVQNDTLAVSSSAGTPNVAVVLIGYFAPPQ